MVFSDVDRVRRLIGETIPAGSTDIHTMFSDAQVADFVTLGAGNLDRAAYEGWKAKAAEYANLVDVSEGNSDRAMSDLHVHALSMMEYYKKLANDAVAKEDGTANTRGRVVIGTVSRRNQY